MIKRKQVLVVLLLGLLLLSLSGIAQDRRARLLTQFEQVTNSLNDGEIVLWVHANGVARVLVKGTDCGAIELDPACFADNETYKVDFFGPLDDLLYEKTGRPIDNLTDLFVFFEPDVSKTIIQEYRTVFRRYERVHCYNCCDRDSGYSCCPNTLNTWFIDNAPVAIAANMITSVHDLKKHGITSIEPIVVSDGSLQEFTFGNEKAESEKLSFFEWLISLFAGEKSSEAPSLIRWLEGKLPHAEIHSLDLTISPNGEVQLTAEDPNWTLSPTSIALVIVVFKSPSENAQATESAVKQAVIREVASHQENPVMVLFTFPDPDSATLSPGLSMQTTGFAEEGVVFVPAAAQPADLLVETVEELKELVLASTPATIDTLVDRLRPLGLLAYMLHDTEQ